MPTSDIRHTRSVNVRDELWTRLHHGFLDAARAVPETMTKSEYLESVFEAGMRVVAADLGIPPPTATTPTKSFAVDEPRHHPAQEPSATRITLPEPPTAAPAADETPAPMAQALPATPPPRSTAPRKSQAERDAERTARLLERAGAPVRPPAIGNARGSSGHDRG